MLSRTESGSQTPQQVSSPHPCGDKDGTTLNQRMASNATAVRRWLEMAAQDLRKHSEVLNALNVFPVADADTGTNLSVTVDTAAQAANLLETPDVSELLTLAGQAALEEARGNSGTLFAVFLTAMGDGLQGAERLNAQALSAGVGAGSVRAWSVLSDPVPGTMLSVLQAAANVPVQPHGEPGSNQELAAYLDALVVAAQQAVLDSTQDLKVLQGTRKVDSGALGVLMILEALRRAIKGPQELGSELWAAHDSAAEPVPAQSTGTESEPHGQGHEPARPMAPSDPVGEVLTRIGYDLCPPVDDADAPVLDALKVANTGVEVMATLDLTALQAATVRHELAETGDSVIVSAVTQIDPNSWRWRVHAHVAEQHMALDILRRHGTPRNITVTGLSKDTATTESQ